VSMTYGTGALLLAASPFFFVSPSTSLGDPRATERLLRDSLQTHVRE
jgi:hypothetical protein